jgi:ACT domain-containing protein
MKTDDARKALLEQLKKTPIVQIACEKAGVSRATFYRWRKASKKFADACDKALESGSALINDMAESQLISAIRDRNITAMIFWLKSHHKAYGTKIELTGKVDTNPMTEEQKELIKRALELSKIYPPKDQSDEESG